MELQRPSDHEERLERARAWALWELGSGSWADFLIREYFADGEDSQRRLAAKRDV